MKNFNIPFGKHGEELAAEYLKKNGYRILECNHRNKLGEMDIIAEEKGTVCFVEVKTRKGGKSGLPFESIPFWKQQKLAKTALWYLTANGLLDHNARFDVVSVLPAPDSGLTEIQVLKDAFEMPFR